MDTRVDEIECVDGGFFMVHLKPGHCLNDDGNHTFGADNKTEIRATMKRVRRCRCDECGQNFVEKRGEICEGCAAYREHTGHF